MVGIVEEPGRIKKHSRSFHAMPNLKDSLAFPPKIGRAKPKKV
jgi:hypothetical protein